jgi:hypothetical protein
VPSDFSTHEARKQSRSRSDEREYWRGVKLTMNIFPRKINSNAAALPPAICRTHLDTNLDSGRAKLLLCLGRGDGERNDVSDRTGKNIASLVFAAVWTSRQRRPTVRAMSRCAALLLSLALVAGCRTASPHQPTTFNFPNVNPAHTHTRLLLENAMLYTGAANVMTDPASGYPVEGWNQNLKQGLYLRQFTQLTAIGEWLELMANIAAGYADNPCISRDEAKTRLIQIVGSLRHDQQDPRVSAEGLLVNFIGFKNSQRIPPLSEIIEKQKFIDAYGEEKAAILWKAMREKGWIVPHHDDQEADIRRSGQYGTNYFTGPLAPFAADADTARIMALMDRRVVQIVFGDNANLSASMAKAMGALLRPEIRNDPAIVALRTEMELFLENQKAGYAHLFDAKTGTFVFGWDATRDRLFGWEDAAGNYTVGHMNYLVNEFRGPLTFVTLRYGFPAAAVANAGLTIKPFRTRAGDDIYTLATWDGSAFQSSGLTLFMQELENAGWRKIMENTVEIELDFAARNRLPGFLSEAYSGQGVEYTGRIGIPDIAIAEELRITNAPSLYTLGAASQIAPDKIERFLETNWSAISRLFTKHGPWEGWSICQKQYPEMRVKPLTRPADTLSPPGGERDGARGASQLIRRESQQPFDNDDRRTVIKYQTTAHTLALILGGIGSAPDNMRRYLEFKGLRDNLLAWYAPGDAVDFLSPETQIIPWTSDGSPINFSRGENSLHIAGHPLRNGHVTLTVPQAEGVNLSNGELIIRYRASTPIEHAVITLTKVQGGPYAEPQFPTQILVRFKATGNGAGEIHVPLPATPGLARTKELVLALGKDSEAMEADLTITALKFVPLAGGTGQIPGLDL